jgi:hypothetical protein
MECYINGMTLISCDEHLLVDFYDCYLNFLNVEENKKTCRFKTDNHPWDITAINSRLFAVTIVTTGEILVINTSSGISKSHSIKVRKYRRGIDYSNGVLVVSFDTPACIQLLDMEGNIMKEFDIRKHCPSPYYIASCYDDNKSVIVFCSNEDALFEFTIDGTVKDKITGNDIKLPEQLVMTHDGAVIVCCSGISNRLTFMTPNTREVLPIAVKGAQSPCCLAISDDQTRMFIFDCSSSDIKVFDIN